jgi:hypothetical protein
MADAQLVALAPETALVAINLKSPRQRTIYERTSLQAWMVRFGHDLSITMLGRDHALKSEMVELRGIEPLTSSLRTRRSPN